MGALNIQPFVYDEEEEDKTGKTDLHQIFSTHREADPTRRMDGEIRNSFLVTLHGLVENPSFSIPYTDSSIVRPTEKVAWIWRRKVTMAIERERRDRTCVLN